MGYETGSTTEYDQGNAGTTANPTVGHTWIIIVGAVVILWLLGGVAFRNVRM